MKQFFILSILLLGLATGVYAYDAPQTVGQYQVQTFDLDQMGRSYEYIHVPPGDYSGGIGFDDSETWFFDSTGHENREYGFFLIKPSHGSVPTELPSYIFSKSEKFVFEWEDPTLNGNYVLEKPNGEIVFFQSKNFGNNILVTIYCEYPDYKAALTENHYQKNILNRAQTKPFTSSGGGGIAW